MEHVARAHGPQVITSKSDHGYGRPLPRDELHLEGIIIVNMHDRPDIPLLKSQIGESPAKDDCVMELHR